MTTTFGEQLLLFARSIDLIDRDRFFRANRLMEQYCHQALGIESVKLWLASEVDGAAGLKRYSLGGFDAENAKSIKDQSRKYNGHTALSFDRMKPIWIVSGTGKQTLEEADKYRDLWSGLRQIPNYRPVGTASEAVDFKTRTSIIIPLLSAEKRALGVLNLETSDYLEITREAKEELSRIAETIGILITLLRSRETQRAGTDTALEALGHVLSTPQPKLTKPKIFLASSSRAEGDVIDLVIQVLHEFDDRLDLVYWKDMQQPGNINSQLLDAIANCRYGICYFSEKLFENGAGSGHKYRDNPNVVFEAGMFHGRIDQLSHSVASWIPIREAETDELPFDFAQERIVRVARYKNGKLDTKDFIAKLRSRLDAMLQ